MNWHFARVRWSFCIRKTNHLKPHLLHFAVVFGGCGNVGITRFYDAPAVQPIVLTFTHAVKHHVGHLLIVFVSRQTDLEEKSKNVFLPVLNEWGHTHRKNCHVWGSGDTSFTWVTHAYFYVNFTFNYQFSTLKTELIFIFEQNPVVTCETVPVSFCWSLGYIN